MGTIYRPDLLEPLQLVCCNNARASFQIQVFCMLPSVKFLDLNGDVEIGIGRGGVFWGLYGLVLGALRLRLKSQRGRVVRCVTIVGRCMIVLIVGEETLTLCSPKRGVGKIMMG